MTSIDAKEIEAVAAAFDPEIVQRTPIDRSRSLGRRVGADVFLKMEHLQRTGSFKTRGAAVKMRRLKERGVAVERVVAASAGNHAQGVALAGTAAGFDVTIVMPCDAPQAKIEATREYGAEVVLHGRDFRAAVDHMETLAQEEGTVVVHAYDDSDVVIGQGTVGLELIEDVPEVDTVIVPIGGGGLISGIGVALAEFAPDVRLVGVQAESAATVPDSLRKGTPVDRDDTNTIADGIATGGISDLTFSLIDEHVDEVLTVSDDEITDAVLFLMERAKQVVEGAGAASVAPLLTGDIDVAGETVVPVLSGGNLDVSMLQTVLSHELPKRNRIVRLRVRIDDEPGVLEAIAGVVAAHNANIRTVEHVRSDTNLHVGEAHLYFTIETSGVKHTQQITAAIEGLGYRVSPRR